MQPSSAPSASTAPARPATPDTVSTGGESGGSGTGTALQDRVETVPAAVVAGWGRRPPNMSSRVAPDDADSPVAAATSSSVLHEGRAALEIIDDDDDDDVPTGEDVWQSGVSNIADRSLVLSESRNGLVPGPSQQQRFSSDRAHQSALAGSSQIPGSGEISEGCVPEAAVTAPTSPTAAILTFGQTSPGKTAAGAKDEVGWAGSTFSYNTAGSYV